MTTMKTRTLQFLAAAGAALFTASSAMAATNQGTGDVAGDSAALTSSNVFSLTTKTLALYKKAFLASDGSVIADGATIPKGTLVKFMIYVNNDTPVAVDDLSARDVLAATFTYQTGTLKVDNSVANCAAATCTTVEEAAVYAAVNATAAKTDGIDGDVVSYNAGTTTIDAGNQTVANGRLDVAKNTVWAMLFTVKMN